MGLVEVDRLKNLMSLREHIKERNIVLGERDQVGELVLVADSRLVLFKLGIQFLSLIIHHLEVLVKGIKIARN
jgi:hypothetical protein